MDPDTHEQEDLSDLPGGRIALEKDYKVLTDYFLRETAFIGAHIFVAIPTLMLYSMTIPPFISDPPRNCYHLFFPYLGRCLFQDKSRQIFGPRVGTI